MKNNLSVSETFYSLQGEGKTMGHPAVFLRLSGCNLLCKSDDWICDSIDVWRKGIKTDFNEVLSSEFIIRLRNGAILVITGGEPLLHQIQIDRYLSWFWNRYNFNPTIEIETNGTIMPTDKLKGRKIHWNVSPKLSNSGETSKKRIKLDVIKWFSSIEKSIFKFVIGTDIDDVIGIISEYELDETIRSEKVWLMAAGSSHEELNETRKDVAELAIRAGMKYTERIHVNIWNQATGV